MCGTKFMIHLIIFESFIIKFLIPTVNELINKVPPVVSTTIPFGASFNLELA